MTRPALTASSRLVASPDQTAAQVGAETVLLSMTAGRYYGFGTVGTRIWQLLQQPTTIADLREAILATYDVDAAKCEADVIGFVGQLIDAGLVQHLDAPAD